MSQAMSIDIEETTLNCGCLLEMYIVTPFLHTTQKDADCLYFFFLESVYPKHKIMMYEPGYLHFHRR